LERKVEKIFDIVVCYGYFEDAPRKPELDVILKTIGAFNLDVEYYVGNSLKGIIAAKRANLKSICVMHINKNKQELLDYGCDIVINNINDLTCIYSEK
jgi:phosphoglycolate phosphatase-like HAD superfamily hydrolase